VELFKDNIKLRAIETSDAEVLKDMINDPELEFMVHGWSLPVSLEQQIEWIKNLDSKVFRFIVEWKSNIVGTCSISSIDYKNSTAALNIKLIGDSNIRGKGIGTTSLQLLIQYCFDELNLNCLTASILEYNIPSLKLFYKCGFKKDGVLRSRIYKKGMYHNTVQLSFLKKEYIHERDRQ